MVRNLPVHTGTQVPALMGEDSTCQGMPKLQLLTRLCLSPFEFKFSEQLWEAGTIVFPFC